MQACADQAHAACTQRDKCSTGGFLNNLNFGSEAVCEMRTAIGCAHALAANGTGQTPTKIETCVAAYPSYMCADFFDNNPPAACIPPVGTLSNGSACGANAQCTSTFCATGPFEVCGKCQALPTVGSMCLVEADCGRDSACVKPAGATALTMGTCAPWALAGGACLTGTAPCGAGLSCVGEDVATMTMGTCKASVSTVGGACDGARKTMPGCDAPDGLVCVPTLKGSPIGTCQAITLVGAGAACGDIGAMPITGFADCEAGGLCLKAAPTDATGVCKSPAPDGMPCDSDPTKGPPCLAPAKCVPTAMGATAGTCTLPDATKCM
jgi:hypothetical protein